MSKKSTETLTHSKSYKTILSRIYIIVLIIISSLITGYLIIQVTKDLNSIFEPSNNSSVSSFSKPSISQSTIDKINEYKDIDNIEASELSNDNNNPFN